MNMLSAVGRCLRLLARDEQGFFDSVPKLLSFAAATPVALGFSFLTMQLFQSSYHRDMVDHAASIAADAMTKSLCSNSDKFGGTSRGTFAGPRQAYVEERVRSQMALVGKKENWHVTAKAGKSAATMPDPGSMPMDVEVGFDAPCTFPFAAQILCDGSPRHLSMKASQSAVAMGCDAGEAWGTGDPMAPITSALQSLGGSFQSAMNSAMQMGGQLQEAVEQAQQPYEPTPTAPADDRGRGQR